jgi:hypothetical protein
MICTDPQFKWAAIKFLSPLISVLATGLFSLALASNFGVDDRTSEIYIENGLVTTHSENIILSSFLKKLSMAAGLEIYIFSDASIDVPIRAHFEAQPLHTVLQTVLKNKSFAVVYLGRRQTGDQDLIIHFRTADGHTANRLPTHDSSDAEEVLLAQDVLKSQMAMLQEQIDSGVSDAEFNKWKAIRGAEYVKHDKERLLELEKKLNSLLSAEK